MKQIIIFLIGICLGGIGLYLGLNQFHHATAPKKAIAVIYPTKNNTVTGTVTFTQEQQGLHVQATLHHLAPGAHGFHIHEFGDCSCDTGMCTKGHFNPTNQKHGDRTDPHAHAGDMGNIVADQNGTAHLDYYDTKMALWGEKSIIGRSVIVHADPDDLVSQPTGNSGDRIGCGVIGIAE